LQFEYSSLPVACKFAVSARQLSADSEKKHTSFPRDTKNEPQVNSPASRFSKAYAAQGGLACWYSGDIRHRLRSPCRRECSPCLARGPIAF
jgi:hypothetical protein